jgi:hypothetical protein
VKIALAIATTDRPAMVGETLRRLARQTRAPDQILVVGAAESDFPAAPDRPPGVGFVTCAKGLTRQRNCALDLLQNDSDIITFIDDDFIPTRDFFAGVERLMTEHPEVLAVSGELIADGILNAGLTFAEADRAIAAYEARGPGRLRLVDDTGTHGANMVLRMSALPQARFDVNLPLYGWLENLDFTAHFAKVGRVVRTNCFGGVHLGVKSGRTSGMRLGYSQIANPIYLVAKGTMRKGPAAKMAIRNFVANLVKAPVPEAYIDRRGRLKGNFLALVDVLRGVNHPTRILEL